MARRPKPWFWTQRDGWYVVIDGKRRELAKGKDAKNEAFQVFHELMAKSKDRPKSAPISVAAMLDHFLDHVKRDQSPSSYETHHQRLGYFIKHIGKDIAAEDIRPFHVNQWIATKKWNDSTRHGVITSIKVAFSWGKREGYIAANPLLDLKRPTATRRMAIMTPEQFAAVYAESSDQRFRDFLTALAETGARPTEIMRLEARMIDFDHGIAVMDSKTSRRTGESRVIYLNAKVLDVCSRLAKLWTKGPLFRNRDGKPWHRTAITQRLIRIRTKLGYGPEVAAGSFRHMFVTDALENQVPIATVAQLVGHTSTDMISRNYSHLGDRREHLKGALQQIRPDDANRNA